MHTKLGRMLSYTVLSLSNSVSYPGHHLYFCLPNIFMGL
ncbi:hypothetical protein VCR4J5_1540004 [Vibrio crassostreae]|uniref:DUF3265 domain-containing protein n=1 Tax=Vibrio crassostreae TaxID=246167 RepID=A0ABP1WQI1_9VIBR|nr:hypothetical protein VCR4J5_1540004 [Vibrio crassostreae]